MTRRSRALLAALAILVVLQGFWVWLLPTWPEVVEPSAPVADPAEQIRRGEYLTRAGNCLACHTARGGAAYAGGRRIVTEFGDFVAPNITPHAQQGIGQWSADDFWRALHYGRGKDGRFLYPAFPYPQYTLVTRADADAMFAYLRTLPASSQVNPPHQLRFPYDQRPLLRLWQALYFKPGAFQPQPAQATDWNRGAYLVNGLAHCGACHTARNDLGAATADHLGGGLLNGWHAPGLGGAGDPAELAALLKTGVSPRHTVYGPMADVVVGSLQYLTDADIQAITRYLQSLPPPPTPTAEPVRLTESDQTKMRQMGRLLYQEHCAACHGGQGQGYAPMYPPLAGNRSLNAMPPDNAIRLVLHGGFPPGTAGNPRPFGMPPFRGVLKDHEVAALVSYIRTAWGNQGGWVTTNQVNPHRAVPED